MTAPQVRAMLVDFPRVGRPHEPTTDKLTEQFVVTKSLSNNTSTRSP